MNDANKTEEIKENEWVSADKDWIMLILLLVFGLGWNTTGATLEKEVAELKGKVEVMERLITK